MANKYYKYNSWAHRYNLCKDINGFCWCLISRRDWHKLYSPRQGSNSCFATIAVPRACLFYLFYRGFQSGPILLAVRLSYLPMLVTTTNTIRSNLLRHRNSSTESVEYSALGTHRRMTIDSYI